MAPRNSYEVAERIRAGDTVYVSNHDMKARLVVSGMLHEDAFLTFTSLSDMEVGDLVQPFLNDPISWNNVRMTGEEIMALRPKETTTVAITKTLSAQLRANVANYRASVKKQLEEGDNHNEASVVGFLIGYRQALIDIYGEQTAEEIDTEYGQRRRAERAVRTLPADLVGRQTSYETELLHRDIARDVELEDRP